MMNKIIGLSSVLFLTMSVNAYAQRHIINQIEKSFIGDATEAKLKEVAVSQDALQAARLTQIKIKVGDEIEFKNVDTVIHNAYGEVFNLKVQAIGRTDVVTFDKAGTVHVRCGIHPKMKLDVIVE